MDSLQRSDMDKFHTADINSIDQALGLLNRAAISNSKEIKQKIGSKFKLLKEVISSDEGFDDLNFYNNLQKKVIARAKDAGHQVDVTAHENPWYFIGGAALIASTIGFVLGRRLKDTRP